MSFATFNTPAGANEPRRKCTVQCANVTSEGAGSFAVASSPARSHGYVTIGDEKRTEMAAHDKRVCACCAHRDVERRSGL